MNDTIHTANTSLAWHYTARPTLDKIVKSGVLKAISHTGDFEVRSGRLVATSPGPDRAIWFSVAGFIDPSIGEPLNVLKKGMEDHQGDPEARQAILDLVRREDAWRWARIGYPEHLLEPIGARIHARLALHGMALKPNATRMVNDWRICRRDLVLTDCGAIELLTPALTWRRVWTNSLPSIAWPSPAGLWQAFSFLPEVNS